MAIARRVGRIINSDDVVDREEEVTKVEKILSLIPSDLLATASYHCKTFPRALMHLEQHIRIQRKSLSKKELRPLYDQIQKVYAKLGNSDGVEGVSTLFEVSTLEQQIRVHEAAGDWSAAQTCYELSVLEDPNNLDYQHGLVLCLKNLGHFGEPILLNICPN